MTRPRRTEIPNPGPLRIGEMIRLIEKGAEELGLTENDWIEFDGGRRSPGQIVLTRDTNE